MCLHVIDALLGNAERTRHGTRERARWRVGFDVARRAEADARSAGVLGYQRCVSSKRRMMIAVRAHVCKINV